MYAAIEEVLKERSIAFEKNVSTASLSTFRIGGRAELLIKPTCKGELSDAVSLCVAAGAPYVLLGGGSNLLFDDGRIEAALIRTTGLDAIRPLPDGRLYAQCGARLSVLAAKAAELGLSGLEFACGIPGTLGGAILMNAGANGSEIGNLVLFVDAFDPVKNKLLTLSHDACGFAYRESCFQGEKTAILGATLQLSCASPDEIRQRMKAFLAKRKATQPARPSAGSTFRRPAPDLPLSRMLDEMGLKGLSVGGAAISTKHAGFIVNNGGATARDVRELIAAVQKIVEKEKGFKPMPEIRFVPGKS